MSEAWVEAADRLRSPAGEIKILGDCYQFCLVFPYSFWAIRGLKLIAMGLVVWGPELSDSEVTIFARKLLRTVTTANLRAEYSVTSFVNIVYEIPGSLGEASYPDYKFGHYSKKEQGVVVAFNVPKSFADGASFVDYFESTLLKGVELGGAFLIKKGHIFPISDAIILARAIIEQVKHENKEGADKA